MEKGSSDGLGEWGQQQVGAEQLVRGSQAGHPCHGMLVEPHNVSLLCVGQRAGTTAAMPTFAALSLEPQETHSNTTKGQTLTSEQLKVGQRLREYTATLLLHRQRDHHQRISQLGKVLDEIILSAGRNRKCQNPLAREAQVRSRLFGLAAGAYVTVKERQHTRENMNSNTCGAHGGPESQYVP